MIVAIVASCLCLSCLPGMEWLTLENTAAKIHTDVENPQSGVLSPVEESEDSQISSVETCFFSFHVSEITDCFFVSLVLFSA